MSDQNLTASRHQAHIEPETGEAERKEPTTQEQAFLEEHGRSLHPALDTQNLKSAETKPTTDQKPFNFRESTYAQTERFKLLVEAYQDASQDPRARALNIRQKNSWDDAMQAARKAEEKYVLAGEAGIRKWSRKITDKATIALPCVRMIPNDMFFSVLSGGLRLIFEVSNTL